MKFTNTSTYKFKLAKTWFKLESLCNKTKTISLSYQKDLEPDGRKRNKAIAALCAAGYLNMVDSMLQITAKVCNEIIGTKPDLTKIFKPFLRDAPSGLSFEDLPLEEQKYIVDNKNDYKFFFESKYLDKTQIPTEFGMTPKDFTKVSNCRLMVNDTAFEQARESFINDKTFKKMRETNLCWGLVKLGLVAEQDIDCIKVKYQTDFNHVGFKPDPSGWSIDLDRELERLHNAIQDNIKKQNVLIMVRDNINNYGGWDKFLSSYDELIVEEISKNKQI